MVAQRRPGPVQSVLSTEPARKSQMWVVVSQNKVWAHGLPPAQYPPAFPRQRLEVESQVRSAEPQALIAQERKPAAISHCPWDTLQVRLSAHWFCASQ